jgi:hypothetical protein
MRTKMKSFIVILALLLVFSLNITKTEAKEVDWEAFSRGLNTALQSSNIGLQQSAMRLVIKYGGDRVNVKESLDHVIKIYKEPVDDETRELALRTIYLIDKKKVATLLLDELEAGMGSTVAKIDALRGTK